MFHSHTKQIRHFLNTYYCSDPVLLVFQVFHMISPQKLLTAYLHILFFQVSVPLLQNIPPEGCCIYLNQDWSTVNSQKLFFVSFSAILNQSVYRHSVLTLSVYYTPVKFSFFKTSRTDPKLFQTFTAGKNLYFSGYPGLKYQTQSAWNILTNSGFSNNNLQYPVL